MLADYENHIKVLPKWIPTWLTGGLDESFFSEMPIVVKMLKFDPQSGQLGFHFGEKWI